VLKALRRGSGDDLLGYLAFVMNKAASSNHEKTALLLMM